MPCGDFSPAFLYFKKMVMQPIGVSWGKWCQPKSLSRGNLGAAALESSRQGLVCFGEGNAGYCTSSACSPVALFLQDWGNLIDSPLSLSEMLLTGDFDNFVQSSWSCVRRLEQVVAINRSNLNQALVALDQHGAEGCAQLGEPNQTAEKGREEAEALLSGGCCWGTLH